RLTENEQGTVHVSQLWGTLAGRIVATGTIIKDVVGLSNINRNLLIQYCATDGTMSDNNISDSAGDSMEGDKPE
ncbi:hypothetical protein BGX29_012300, partial [Mortierella sp. GBA35]